MGENPIALRSKKRLIDALDTIMRQKAYRDITITELCNEAGLSRPAFYQNFGRIDDVLKRLVAEKIKAALDSANFGKPGDASDLAEGCVGILEHDAEFINILVENELDQLIAVELAKTLATNTNFMASLGRFDDKQSQRYYAAYTAAGISIELVLWLGDRASVSREDVVNSLTDVMRGKNLS